MDDLVEHQLLDAARLVQAWREGDQAEVRFLVRRLELRAAVAEPAIAMAARHFERVVAVEGLPDRSRCEAALALLLTAVDRSCVPLKVPRG